MDKNVTELDIIKVREGIKSSSNDIVVNEDSLTICCNNVEVATLLCSPGYEGELAIGFLVAGGILRNASEIHTLTYMTEEKAVYIKCATENADRHAFLKKCITSGCGRGTMFMGEDFGKIPKYSGNLSMQSENVLKLMQEMQVKSKLYLKTGGVHSAALASDDKIIVFREDVGRHNAVDKIIGHALQNNITLEDKFLLTSGRMSSEIIVKIAQAGLGGIVSRSAPTARAVDYAKMFNITMLGFARGRGFNIYTGSERVK
jgi:FdhD protein